MSEEKKESSIKTLRDVLFVYSSVTHASKQLNKDGKLPLSDDPLELHSYEIKVLVSEKTFKALKKQFRTSTGTPAKNFPNAKELTAEEIEKDYGIEVEDDMVLIKFAQSALTGKKGNRYPSRQIPVIGSKKSVSDSGTKYFDNAGQIIEGDTSLGNGTKGHLQFKPVENAFGLYLYPAALCITDLEIYVATGSDYDEDAFGVEDFEGEVPAEEAQEDVFDGDDEFGV